jgi:hypothetical protein
VLEGTDSTKVAFEPWMSPVPTSTSLLVETWQFSCIPVGILTRINSVDIDIGASWAERPVSAGQELAVRNDLHIVN